MTSSGCAGRARSHPLTCTWSPLAREQLEVAVRLAEELELAGLRVLVDDRRDASPGVKFADAELLGVPTIVVVGRGLANGVVELRDRRSGDREEVPVAAIVQRVLDVCRHG